MAVTAENQTDPTLRRAKPRRPTRMTEAAFLSSDFEAFAEWVSGKVIYMTVTDAHDTISGFVYSLLRFLAEERGLGRAKAAPFAMRLGPLHVIREPDVMFVLQDNLHRIRRAYLDGAADIVVEVVSPESRARDRRDKFYEYATAGVSEYWIVDPDRKRAHVFVLGEDGVYEETPSVDGILRSRQLPDFWVREEWFWPETMPKVTTVLKEWGLLAP
jgi:Uma2 family endonuclease